MAIVTASFEYNGLPDYWGGNGRRWDDNAGCIFAYYGAHTTLREIIDGAVDDFNAGGDCDSFPEDVDGEMVREALLDCLTSQGRADYENGAISEFAVDYAAVNEFDTCRECGARRGDEHEPDCEFIVDDPDRDNVVEDEDCEPDYEYHDSPFVVFLIECSVCSVCGKAAEYEVDDICAECAEEEEKWHVGDDVFIDNGDYSPVWGKIVELDDTSAVIDFNGEKIRKEFGEFTN
jgi:hypothetical protein